MEIKRETTVTALTTDNKPMEIGEKYIFNADNRCFAGEFLGLSNRGALQFAGVISDCNVLFNVMPRSVDRIYLAEVKVVGADETKSL